MIDDDSSPAPSDPGLDPTKPFQNEGSRYERQGLLGQGGMGRVYAALDRSLHRQVAYKVAATPELAGRLAREAWITAQLEHPGIVAVYDAGETEGQAWYTMRLCRGRTLRERLAACPDLAARLSLLPHLQAACQAVAYAHAMGIVHRDLKPSNIMVGEFGETQVADWGLATPIDTALPDWQRIVNPAGDVSGTPRYMSPEQALGAPPSCTADVFGLGSALYELLFGTDGRREPGEAHRFDANTAPPELVAIAKRCLHADPADRYPTAKELADDLGRWLSGRRVLAHEYRPVELLVRLIRVWRVPLGVAAVAFVVLTGVVVAAVARTAKERRIAEDNLAVALTRQALTALLDERLPEASVLAAHVLKYGPSPEARGILAATRRNTPKRVWSVTLPPACQHSATVSPDAARLACYAGGKLEIWEMSPLALQSTLNLVVVEEPVWLGERLLVATPDALTWVHAGEVVATTVGVAWRPLASTEAAFATRGPDALFLRPDGSVLPFPICTATRATTRVVRSELVVGCDDGVLRTYDRSGALTREHALGIRPHWSAVESSPDGLFIGRLDGGVQQISLADGAQTKPLPGLAHSIRALQPVPGTANVLVLSERGGPRVWNTLAGGWSGSLPAGASRMFPGKGAGEVLLLGEKLQAWRVATTSSPTVLLFATGVSQVVPSPTGQALAVALGSGEIVERRLADGDELRRWQWVPGVAKGVAYGQDGLLVAGAMGEPGRILGPTGESRALPPTHVLRRLGRLNDGRVWAIDYQGGALWIDPKTGDVTAQALRDGPFDGSSSPSGDTAAVLDARGEIWLSKGAEWRNVRSAADAVAVDIGNGGAPIVTGLRREVCVDEHCFPVADDVLDVAYFPGRVAVGTLAGDVHLFDATTGATLAVLRGHQGRVTSVEFGPEGDWLASGSWDGTARIWDLTGLDEPADSLIAQAEASWGLDLDDAMRGR